MKIIHLPEDYAEETKQKPRFVRPPSYDPRVQPTKTIVGLNPQLVTERLNKKVDLDFQLTDSFSNNITLQRKLISFGKQKAFSSLLFLFVIVVVLVLNE
jgi:hypothetical protein